MIAKNPPPSKQSSKCAQDNDIFDPRPYQHHTKITNSKVNKIQEEIGKYYVKLQTIERDFLMKSEELLSKEKSAKELERFIIENSHVLTVASRKTGNADLAMMKRLEREHSRSAVKPPGSTPNNKYLYEEINNLRNEKNMYKKINLELLREIDQNNMESQRILNKVREMISSREKIEDQITQLESMHDQTNEMAKIRVMTIKHQLDEENKKSKINLHKSMLASRNQFSIKNKTSQLNYLMGSDQRDLTKVPMRTTDSYAKNGLISITQNRFKQSPNDDKMSYAYASETYVKDKLRNFSEPKHYTLRDKGGFGITTNSKLMNKSMSRDRGNKFDFSRVKADHQDFHSSQGPKQTLTKFEFEKKELKNHTNELKHIFQHLFRETNTQDVDELINYVKVLEEEKSKLYFETQNMLEQIELLKDTKFSLQMEIKERENQKFSHNVLKEKAIEEFQVSTKEIDAQIDHLAKQKSTIQSVAKFLSFGIVTILERAAFSSRERAYASSLDITNETVPYYLQMLEKKTNKILKIIKDKNLQEQLFQIEKEPEKKFFLDEKIKEGIHLFEEMIREVIRLEDKEGGRIFAREEKGRVSEENKTGINHVLQAEQNQSKLGLNLFRLFLFRRKVGVSNLVCK